MIGGNREFLEFYVPVVSTATYIYIRTEPTISVSVTLILKQKALLLSDATAVHPLQKHSPLPKQLNL